MITLNLFPARIPIGTVKADNVTYDVLMTPEFARALSSLLERVGGEANYSVDDLALLAATQDDGAAQDAALAREVAALRQQVEMFSEMAGAMGAAMARIAQLEATLDQVSGMAAAVAKSDAALRDVQIQMADVPTPTDWEHPGRIGAGSPNTGSFSRLNAGAGSVAGTAALPSFYLGADKTTGYYRIGLDNWGFSVNATKLLDFSSHLLQIDGRVRINEGTEALPALYFGTDPDSGLYQIGFDHIGVAIGGTKVLDVQALRLGIDGIVVASGQIYTTVADGTAPFVVSSSTLVPTLYVARAVLADTATALTPNGSTYPPYPTPLTIAAASAAIDTLSLIMQSRGL